MKIMDLIRKKEADNTNQRGVTIAFLGDSVTQGCFEVYKKRDNRIETIFDRNATYHGYLSQIFSMLFPSVPINIINAGISGGSAPHGFKRLENDVLRYNPDLVVVCFGLNDANAGLDYLKRYETALRDIFQRLQKEKIEVIFMTPNMMNTELSEHINDKEIMKMAEVTRKTQCSGIMDAYVAAAKNVCKTLNVPVCDCYAKWKTLYENGVNVTELLANKINHPMREMNWLFAISLVETMMKSEGEAYENSKE